MRVLVTLEFADAGTKSGTHPLLIIGRGTEVGGRYRSEPR